MPSQARILARDKMIPEVRRLLEAHTQLRKGCKGRDPHNAVLKSAVVFLCATWEYYCENIAAEAAKKISESGIEPRNLPNAIKEQLKLRVHHENVQRSDPMVLAGDGWRAVYIEAVREHCAALNTPKSEPVGQLFKKCLGYRSISDSWTHGTAQIDSFVSVRGEIAHRGSDAEKVTRDQISHFIALVSKTITDTDDALYDYLRDENLLGRAPWQKTQKN